MLIVERNWKNKKIFKFSENFFIMSSVVLVICFLDFSGSFCEDVF